MNDPSMNILTDPVSRYVLNFEEFLLLFKGLILDPIDDALKDKYPQLDTHNIEALLEDLKDLLPDTLYRKIKGNIDFLIRGNDINGSQKIDGKFIDVPPIIQEVKETFKFNKDIYITGFHFNQTGWKKQDRYCLLVNKHNLIQDATIKEIGEHKLFNTFFMVNANTPIDFILKNHSGNSRQTFIDLEYIEKADPPPPPTPPHEPTIFDINHDWDIAVVLNWQINIATDVDLHGFMGDTHVWYSNLNDNGLYLDFDCLSHIGNSKSEIMSVKGNTNKSLEVYVNHFSGDDLTEPITIQVYKNAASPHVIKEYKITLLQQDYNYLVGVCSINLNTLTVSNISNKKKFR